MKAAAINPIRMTIPLSGAAVRDAMMLGLSLKKQAEEAGGAGRVIRAPDRVVIDLEGLQPDLVDELTAAFGEALIRKGATFSIANTSRTADLPDCLMCGELLQEKLSKKILLGLPPGAWLVSDHSRWKVHLKKDTDRQRVWDHAVEQGVANRKVSVAWSESDVEVLRTA